VPLSKRYYGSNCSGSVVSICCLKSWACLLNIII
jgi:hypothetical protein